MGSEKLSLRRTNGTENVLLISEGGDDETHHLWAGSLSEMSEGETRERHSFGGVIRREN